MCTNRAFVTGVKAWVLVMVDLVAVFALAFRLRPESGRLDNKVSLLESLYFAVCNMFFPEYAPYRILDATAARWFFLERVLGLLVTAVCLGYILERHEVKAASAPEAWKARLVIGLLCLGLVAATVVMVFANLHFIAAYDAGDAGMSIWRSYDVSLATLVTIEADGFVPRDGLRKVLVCLEAALGVFLLTGYLGYVVSTHTQEAHQAAA